MRDDQRHAIEEFLVEHVMIGLGNIRGAIARIESAGEDAAQVRQLAFNRIGAQIDHLESRARTLHGMIRRLDTIATPELAAGPATAPVLFQSRRTLN